eukprot:EG_transcript_8302
MPAAHLGLPTNSIAVTLLDVQQVPVEEGRRVQLSWHYAGEEDHTRPAMVNRFGLAVFNHKLTLRQHRRSQNRKGEQPVLLTLCLFELNHHDKLGQVMDKIALDLSDSHLCSGRLGMCGAKQIVFSLLISVEDGTSLLSEPETPQRKMFRRPSSDVADLERQLRRERRTSQALEAEVQHWKGVAELAPDHSWNNSRSNSEIGLPDQPPPSPSPGKHRCRSKPLNAFHFPDGSPMLSPPRQSPTSQSQVGGQEQNGVDTRGCDAFCAVQ